jgi:dicarboxylate transporter 10
MAVSTLLPSQTSISAQVKRSKMSQDEKRLPRWYFGGLASAGAACITHPLDTIKVHLQTAGGGKEGIIGVAKRVIKSDGIMGLYSGLTASLLRQLTYSTARIGIYEVAKQAITKPGEDISVFTKLFLAATAGAAGGVIGTPADMVNVRMQNDMKLPVEQRRKYKHAIDGLWRVYREEGASKLFNGCGAATGRAVLMNSGQLASYDTVKKAFLDSGYFTDSVGTHFLSSIVSGAVATLVTQPLDVLKTKAMNAKPGEYSGNLDIAMKTAKHGPLAFFKGFVPAFIRIGPHTVLLFLIMEQLRMNFGIVQEDPNAKKK